MHGIFPNPVPGHHLEHQGFRGLSIVDGVHGLCSIGHSGLNPSRVNHQHPALFDQKETQAFCSAKFASRKVCTKQLVQEPRLACRVLHRNKSNKTQIYSHLFLILLPGLYQKAQRRPRCDIDFPLRFGGGTRPFGGIQSCLLSRTPPKNRKP